MIDLHAHLGSMVSPEELWRIAKLQGINTGFKNYSDFRNVFSATSVKNHNEYLNKYKLTHMIQSTPMGVRESIYAAVKSAYDDGIDGIEIRFNPMFRNNDALYDLDTIILEACIGLNRAKDAFNVHAGIIISTDKSFTEEESLILARKAVKYENFGIVGFDASGATCGLSDMEKLRKAYMFIFHNSDKVGLTVHAGELPLDGNSEIEYAVNELRVKRIGHGVQAYKNMQTMELLSHNDVCLEMCPNSNITTKIFDESGMINAMENLVVNGVNITLNTDGKLFLGTSLKNEYSYLDKSEILINKKTEILSNSLNYSFIKF